MNNEMRHEAQPALVKILEEHLLRLRRETPVSMYAFTATVREHYEAMILPHHYGVEWSLHADTVTRMKRDAEMVSRWFSDDVNARFPVDALESFIAAFPEDRRFALQVELADRQGMLACKRPSVDPSADIDNIGRLAKEFGDAMVVLSQMLADGVINARDASLRDDALRQLNENMAVLAEMYERVRKQATDHQTAK